MQTQSDAPVRVVPLVLVISICFGWFIFASIQSVLDGFPVTPFYDATLWGICLFEVLMTVVALTVLRLSGFNVRSLIPAPSARGTMHGAGIALGALVLSWPLAALFGADHPAIEHVTEMAAQSRVTLPAALAVSVVNGAYEEIFLCGYVLRAVERLGASMAIGLSTLIRLLYHLYQGPYGALAVVGFGLLASIYFWRTRQLWPIVFAHASTDLVALAGDG
jgi:membrane protease YdiL (CAAX protease family)